MSFSDHWGSAGGPPLRPSPRTNARRHWRSSSPSVKRRSHSRSTLLSWVLLIQALSIGLERPLERRFLKAEPRRFAPFALGGSSHHRAIWSVSALSFCPETLPGADLQLRAPALESWGGREQRGWTAASIAGPRSSTCTRPTCHRSCASALTGRDRPDLDRSGRARASQRRASRHPSAAGRPERSSAPSWSWASPGLSRARAGNQRSGRR